MNITNSKAPLRHTEAASASAPKTDRFGFHKPEKSPMALDEEPAATLELSDEALKNPRKTLTPEESRNNDTAANSSGGLIDDSGKLTRRLVAASTQEEVRLVLSDVYKNILSWQMAAAGGDEKAGAVVRRLNRLIRRCNRKIRDLNKEEAKLQQQQRAEKAKQEYLERKLREELKRAEKERKNRERQYLHDHDSPKDETKHPPRPSVSALERKIIALSMSLEQLSTSPGGTDLSPADGASAAADDEAKPAEATISV